METASAAVLDPVDPEPDAWRDELSARLDRYRARRKARPPRYPSLRLPFAPAGSFSRVDASRLSSPEPVFEIASNHALALDPLPHEFITVQPEQPDPHQASPEPQLLVSPPEVSGGAKIIEFPRFAWAPPVPPPDQLAEPVSERPRILEVPEIVPPAPALGGITIEPVEPQEIEKRPGIDTPLQSAPLRQRLFASAIDALIVAAASALFGYIFWKVAAVEPVRPQLLGIVAGVLTLTWAAYQYVLIVYGGTTPGLRLAGLHLCRFDASGTSRSLRRWRVLGSYLSAASLGMGYAWVFLDEDVLCWHDRITHTYLAPSQNGSSSGKSTL
jgi:uncharacterized RDD family membrane protein YckC